MPTKLCLPGAVHVRPLCWSRHVLDDERHHREIKFALDMQISCNDINVGEGAGKYFGHCQCRRSRAAAR